jgi:uncharacterized cupredoxin-like copper-binding protein
MRRQLLTMGLVAAAVVLVLAVAACSSKKSSSDPTATTSSTATGETPGGGVQSAVKATLTDYKILPEPASVPAGRVTFNITNIGATEHELVVVKTDLGSGDLPTKADGSANEEGPGLTAVDEAESMAAGEARSLTVDLEPGNYVLFCNVVQTTNGQTVKHYQQGMHVAFTVTP